MEKNNNDALLIERIQDIKKRLGEELVILAHHYQRKEIVDLSDYRGDSFGLSQKASLNTAAKYIVFCGVHFMAESAAILAQPHQTVQLPDMNAGCWMAEMADSYIVMNAWKKVVSITGADAVTPMVYMNADAEIKAFCGSNGGIICTSSNAAKAFEWAFKRRGKIFFFPDQHLGRNTGNQMAIPPEEMILWDPEKKLGGNTPDQIKSARVILWKGYCLVHTRFKAEHIIGKRKKYPDAQIVVHPECTEDVVGLADATGSTSFIVKYVKEAPPGATIIIGTEINLVHRLALEYPDKKILTLRDSPCPNMHKITLKKLLKTLEKIGSYNVVTVSETVKNQARVALDNMLSLND